MIDKKKLQNALNNKTKKPLPKDLNMTLEVKNDEVEALMKEYLEEKTPENLNKLIEQIRTCRVLVPANLNEKRQPLPCLIRGPKDEIYLPLYTCLKQVPKEPKSAAIMNMPYLAVNHMAIQQGKKVMGIIINPFTQPLVFKRPLVEKIDDVEKKRKASGSVKLTEDQYLQYERKEFEYSHLPKRLFQQGREMMDLLCEKKEEYIDELFEEGYQQNRMYPYLPEDFSVMVMNISDDLRMVRVDLPNRDMGIPSCYRVYLSWKESTGEGRYFAIERTKDSNTHLLGEIDAKLRHINHGEAPVEGAELQRIIDLVCEEDGVS